MREESRKLIHSLVHLPYISRLVWQTHPLYALTLTVVTIAQGLLPPLNIWIGKLVIDAIVQIAGSQSSSQNASSVFFLVSIELGLTVLGTLLNYVRQMVQEILGQLLSYRVQVLILEKATTLDLSFYENSTFHDKLQRAQQEASYRPLALLSQLIQLVQSSISLSSLLVLLISFRWPAVLVLLILTIPGLFVQWRYAEAGYLLMKRQTSEFRRLSYVGHLLISLFSVKEIKLFGLSKYFLARYARLFNKLLRQNKELAIRRNTSSLKLAVLGSVSFYGFYFYVIRQTILQIITLGDLTLYSRAFSQSQSYLKTVLGNVKEIYEHSLFTSNLFEFLALESRLKVFPTTASVPPRITSGIEFRNVSFCYPGSDKAALKNINLKIGADQTVALVGGNGAGKTTLIKLLCRFYDPCEGEILIDEENIKLYNIESLRQCIGAIFQDYAAYQLSARENIGLGKVKAIHNHDRIVAAARRSGVDKVIENLPRGYETMLGSLFENSSQLSIGEWQKLALARAFMRDAPVLILDEPTASLDAETENELFQIFRQMTSNRITILISHRFSTVRAADLIFVLNDGQIIEQGSHEELMRMNGRYARLFRLQAEKYQ